MNRLERGLAALFSTSAQRDPPAVRDAVTAASLLIYISIK